MTFNSHLRTSSVLLQAFIKVHDAMLADYLYTQTFLSQRLGAESLSLSVITYHMFRCGGVNLCSAVHFLKKSNQISYFWIKLKLNESCSCFFLPPLSLVNVESRSSERQMEDIGYILLFCSQLGLLTLNQSS